MASDLSDSESTACAFTRALEEVLNRRRVRPVRPWRWLLDPHLIEILQKLVVAIDEARYVARCARTPEALAEVAALRSSLDKPERASKLSRESAVELLDTVDRMVIRLADEASVHAAAEREAERMASVEVVTRRIERTFETLDEGRAG